MICILIRFFKGGLNYTEALNLPLTEIFRLQKIASKIDSEEARSMQKG